MHSWPPATKPWERIHIDNAGPHLGRHFLIIVDAYSKYPEVIAVPNTTSQQTVATLRKLCAQNGVPEKIVSDNGTQFTDHEFEEFCKANAVSHILSPPYHPQSNGRAERFVDTFKRGLLKLRGEGDVDKILDTFLLAYRTTPNATVPQQRCPAQLFFGLKPRTTLDLLLPKRQPTGRDTKMERQFNSRHGAVERNFNGGDPVYIRYRQSHDWMTGSVAKRIGDRLYDVTLSKGATRRFHANQIRPRSTQLTDDDFMAFADVFNVPVRRPQPINGETRLLDEHAGKQVNIPALDNDNPKQSSNTLPEPRRSKRGHISKKQFELDPRRKSYKYP